MRRREFIAGLSGAVAVLDPVRAWGQRTNQVRWIGVLLINSEDDAAARDGVIVFENQLKQSGWVVGGNLAIDYRWGVSDGRRARDAVGQLLRLTPDVILANGGPALTAAQQATGTVPIVDN